MGLGMGGSGRGVAFCAMGTHRKECDVCGTRRAVPAELVERTIRLLTFFSAKGPVRRVARWPGAPSCAALE
jgi:hypothetical protein